MTNRRPEVRGCERGCTLGSDRSVSSIKLLDFKLFRKQTENSGRARFSARASFRSCLDMYLSFRPTFDDNRWRYCLDCHSRYFDTGKKASGHIPFRDRASQSSMRRPADKEVVETQDEPEEEPIAETQQDSGEAPPELPLLDEEEEEEDGRDEAGDPLAEEDSPDPVDTKWPTLDEYKVKWASLLEKHSRPNDGGFSRTNLVPAPIPQLWQDCPYVPFDALKTDDAMSRLSRCRPVSGFRPSHCEDGIIRFAHNTGDSWWLKVFNVSVVLFLFGVG